jgi:hypothetical protein
LIYSARRPSGTLAFGVCGMIELDIYGSVIEVSRSAVVRLRDLAAARAGGSSAQRDLSLLLDRALGTHTKVALQRGEARALLELVATEPADPEIAALADTIRAAR